MTTIQVTILPDGRVREINRLSHPSELSDANGKPYDKNIDENIYRKAWQESESKLRTFTIGQKHGKIWIASKGDKRCAECCNKDRCDDDCDLYYRPNCPYCLGRGINLSCFEIGFQYTAEIIDSEKLIIRIIN